MFRLLLACALLLVSGAPNAESKAEDKALRISVEELRSSIGRWNVVTEFLQADGTVARSVEGTYEFSWVVPDRVVSGRNNLPALQQSSGILFYIQEKKRQIEMVSVGADGVLWTMTGALGGNERFSQTFETATGATARLRFTRFNVEADRFESKMDYTEDGGKTWTPGNRQRFVRLP